MFPFVDVTATALCHVFVSPPHHVENMQADVATYTDEEH